MRRLDGNEMKMNVDETTKTLLERMFATEASFGPMRQEPDGETVFVSDGSAAVFCTSIAAQVRHILGEGRVEIVGFSEEDNPTSAVAQAAGGHDFALVDGRYIVDGWIRDVECLSDRIVFDMESDDDRAEIERLYGDPVAWESAHDKHNGYTFLPHAILPGV